MSGQDVWIETRRARGFRLFMAAGAALVVACGGDASVTGPEKLVTKTPAAGDSSTTTPRPPTSTGPVVTVSVSPQQVTLQQGYYATLVARPLDAKGVLVTGRAVQWRSSDAAVAVSSDTGLVYARAVGTAKVYASVDGHTDSATIAVTPRVPPPPPPPDTAQTPAAVSSFALTVSTIAGVGSDTLRTEPVAGVTITVTRIATVKGDPLIPPVVAGTAVTDARGEAKFAGLAAGYYTVLATPPAGSRYQKASTGFSPPRTAEVSVRIFMRP
jgi:hypothetical protein